MQTYYSWLQLDSQFCFKINDVCLDVCSPADRRNAGSAQFTASWIADSEKFEVKICGLLPCVIDIHNCVIRSASLGEERLILVHYFN